MTLPIFASLTTQDKVDLLYQQGIYIGKRKVDRYSLLLFQVDSFYVEIRYLRYRVEIDAIHCYASTDCLDPYLDQIPIQAIVLTK